MLKPDSLPTDSCNHIDRVVIVVKMVLKEDFYVYTCLFTDSHITLPFEEFIWGP